MQILAIFTESSVPKESLEPTIKIFRLDTGALVIDGEPMTEISDGQYSYSFIAWDGSIDYSVICTSSLSGSEKYAYTSISASPIVEDVLSEMDILRLLLAKECGVASGGGSSLIEFKSLDLAKTRIAMSTTMRGDRATVTLDGTE